MNTNCLKGVMCPGCGHTDNFEFLVGVWVPVDDDGTDNLLNHDVEWDDNSMVACGSCDHREQLANFKQPGFYVTFDVVTEESAEHGEAERRGWWEPGGWEYDDKPDSPAYSFDPEDFDEEEHENLDEAIVDWAVKLLKDEGAVHPSSSPWSPRDWVGTGAEEDGMVRSFHFHGFSDHLIERVLEEVAS